MSRGYSGCCCRCLWHACGWNKPRWIDTGLLFPDVPSPRRGLTYPWRELVGLLPRPDYGPKPRLAPRLARGYAELAMDFEATSGRVLPVRPEHALWMTVLPLQERAAVLRQAVRALQPHLLVGRLLPAEESARCHSLIALGGHTYLGLQGRPYFAARDEMVRMLEGLAAHCVTQWQ